MTSAHFFFILPEKNCHIDRDNGINPPMENMDFIIKTTAKRKLSILDVEKSIINRL